MRGLERDQKGKYSRDETRLDISEIARNPSYASDSAIGKIP